MKPLHSLAVIATLSLCLICFGQVPPTPVINRTAHVFPPRPDAAYLNKPLDGFDFAGWPTTNVCLLVQMATNLTPPVYWVDVTNGVANGHWHKAHWPTNEVLPQRFYRVLLLPK